MILVRQHKPKRTFFIDLATCIGVLSFGASAFITKEHTIDESFPAKKISLSWYGNLKENHEAE